FRARVEAVAERMAEMRAGLAQEKKTMLRHWAVTFGNFTTIGGRNVVVGGESGYDTEAIIGTLVEAESLTLTSLQDDVSVVSDEVTELGNFNSIVTNLQASLDILRNPPGVNNEANNIFEYRNAFLTSNSSVAANSYLGITVDPGANITNFDIEIEKIAAFQQDRSTVAVASKDTSLFASNTSFIINDNTGSPAATIAIDSGDTLENIVAKVNAVQDVTGVSSYIVQVDSNDFRLVFEGDETGTNNSYSLDFSGDTSVSTALGTISNVQAADDASFTIDGLAVTRQSNVVNDLLDDVTLNLFNATPDFGLSTSTTLSVEVSQNTDLIVAAVDQFVTDYNEYREYVAAQTERDPNTGAYTEDAILAQNNSLNSLVRQIDDEVLAAVSGLTGDSNELADIGIVRTNQEASADGQTIAVDGILSVNTTILSNALTSDPNAFRKIFEFDLSDSAGKITSFDRDNNLSIDNFSVDVDITRDAEDAVLISYTDPITGAAEEYFANYRPSTDNTVTNDITSSSIFGASTTDAVFSSGITDGDRIRFTVNDPINGATNYDFTYATTITDITTEFNSLDSLSTVINSQSLLNASISNNQLSITPSSGTYSVDITNLDATDIKSGLGISDIDVIGGLITMDAKDRAISNDITTTNIFGASTTSASFSSGITDGDSIVFSVTDATNVVTDYSFTYRTSPSLATEFNSLDSLAAAIDAQSGLNGNIYNNKLVVSSVNDTDNVAINNGVGSSADIKAALGVSDILDATSKSSSIPFSGLQLIYSGDGTDNGSDSLDVTVTQGIADRIYNVIDAFTVDGGIIDTDVDSLNTVQEVINDDIEAWEIRIEAYRLSLVDLYARLEAEITAANSIISLIESQDAFATA
ncbi:MAG: flagellar filament capping protein FliD, partial [Pseudomonadota bacterium]